MPRPTVRSRKGFAACAERLKNRRVPPIDRLRCPLRSCLAHCFAPSRSPLLAAAVAASLVAAPSSGTGHRARRRLHPWRILGRRAHRSRERGDQARERPSRLARAAHSCPSPRPHTVRRLEGPPHGDVSLHGARRPGAAGRPNRRRTDHRMRLLGRLGREHRRGLPDCRERGRRLARLARGTRRTSRTRRTSSPDRVPPSRRAGSRCGLRTSARTMTAAPSGRGNPDRCDRAAQLAARAAPATRPVGSSARGSARSALRR